MRGRPSSIVVGPGLVGQGLAGVQPPDKAASDSTASNTAGSPEVQQIWHFSHTGASPVVASTVQGRLLLNRFFTLCVRRRSCLVFFPLLPLINLPRHLQTWHDVLKSTTGLHQSWHSRNQMAELWKMEAVITTCLGVWDAAECQSERPLPLYQRHSSSEILSLDARLNYWLKCKYFSLHAPYIPITCIKAQAVSDRTGSGEDGVR